MFEFHSVCLGMGICILTTYFTTYRDHLDEFNRLWIDLSYSVLQRFTLEPSLLSKLQNAQTARLKVNTESIMMDPG